MRGEIGEVIPELNPAGGPGGAGKKIADDPSGGVGDGGWWGGGVDEGAGAVDQEIDSRTAGGDVAATEAHGLAEGAEVKIYLFSQPVGGGESVSVWAIEAEAVSFIEEEQGAMFFDHGDEIGQWSEIAIHAEDRFGDDEDASVGADLLHGPVEAFF
jgi:hypothetical protein